MRVIQIPFCFYPDRVGGTEVYVEMLARELRARGLEVIVAAPGERSAVYEHGGLPVYRFAVTPRVADVRDLYGFGDERAAAQLGEILDRVRPDLVHMHAFTRGASLRSVREARARRVPVVFTYHTPTVSCPRGTLMRWGTGVCSGELDSDLWARCTLRAAFLGRLDPVKGAHVLVEAIRLGPDLPVALDLYGVEQGEASAAYLSRLRKIAGGDRRITFRDPVTPGTVTTRLRPYD